MYYLLVPLFINQEISKINKAWFIKGLDHVLCICKKQWSFQAWWERVSLLWVLPCDTWCHVAWYIDISIAEGNCCLCVFKIRVLPHRWSQHMSILLYRMRQQQGCHILEEMFEVANMSTSNLTVSIVLYFILSNLIYSCWVFSNLIAFPIQTHLRWRIKVSVWEVHGFIHSQKSSVWFCIITLLQMQEENPAKQSFTLSMQVALQTRWWDIWNPVRSVLF